MELIENFLTNNLKDIPQSDLPQILKAAEKSIVSGTLSFSHIPEHLRGQYRQILIEQSYRNRVKGQRFTIQKGAMMI